MTTIEPNICIAQQKVSKEKEERYRSTVFCRTWEKNNRNGNTGKMEEREKLIRTLEGEKMCMCA